MWIGGRERAQLLAEDLGNREGSKGEKRNPDLNPNKKAHDVFEFDGAEERETASV